MINYNCLTIKVNVGVFVNIQYDALIIEII